MAKAPPPHDFEAQRKETFETFEELRKEPDLPKRAVVHFLFFAEVTDPDWAGAEKALAAAGFRTERDEDEVMIDAAFGPIDVTPESIWERERMSTEIALRFDFYPDGWDMLTEE
jgi:hypothetical protein